MQSLEKLADKNGLSYRKMMQNAGTALAKEIQTIAHRYYADEVSINGLVGPGNNGGDTLIALAKLAGFNHNVTGYLLFKKIDQQELIDEVISNGGSIVFAQSDNDFKLIEELMYSCDILLDGILGTGFKLPLHTDLKAFLVKIKKYLEEMEIPPIIVAVDCPSGVDNSTGETSEETITADFTVCMAAVKEGLLKLPAYTHIGELIVVDIGLTRKNSEINEIKKEVVNSYKITRPLDSHKGTFGTCLIVAGSSSYSGAALLAGKAAYRVGAGLVTMAVPSILHAILAGHLPEATWILLPHQLGSINESASNVLLKYVNNADSMLIGCGLGREDTTLEFMKSFLTEKANIRTELPRIGFLHTSDQVSDGKNIKLPPLVIDADGLNLLSQITNWHKLLPEYTILTPHPGEMQLLTGVSKEKIQNDRLNIARKYADEWHTIVVLKGAFTVIASPGGDTTTIPVATSALARAGSGDVLAGMIAGFLAQGMQPYKAAITGAWYHSQAGLIAAEKLGCTDSVMAGDVINAISESISIDLN